MMSAAQSQTSLLSKLEALQCHFTWYLDLNKTKILRLRDMLEDIGTEEGNCWLGHIYNLRGFIQYKLGFTEDAQSFFNKAAEAFRQMRKADEGSLLVVNYGNLAWLHHHLGDQAESEAYLSKVEALMKKYPSPSKGKLHAEMYAEKAWTLMKFKTDRELVADYFRKAIRMQPDMVEWNTSHVIGLASAFKHYDKGLEADLLEKMRVAKEQDPENLCLAVYYLQQRANKGEDVKDEAHVAVGSQSRERKVKAKTGHKTYRCVQREETREVRQRRAVPHRRERARGCFSRTRAEVASSCTSSSTQTGSQTPKKGRASGIFFKIKHYVQPDRVAHAPCGIKYVPYQCVCNECCYEI